MSNTSLSVKAFLELPDSSIETRRFVVEKASLVQAGAYQQIHEKIGGLFPDLKGMTFSLYWKDEDDDYVTVSTDEEIKNVMELDVCRFYIQVKDAANETSRSSNQDGGDKKGNHNIDMPNTMDGYYDNTNQARNDTNEGSGGFPIGPPRPPPPFGFFSGFGGPYGFGGGHFGMGRRGKWHGMKHGGFQGHHHHHHPFPPHFWSHSHQGHGHEGHWGQHPYHGGRHHMNRHGAGFGGGYHHHKGHGKCGGKHGGNFALRDMVPAPHRRWAKGFIQAWRKENVNSCASATSTESESASDPQAAMEKAGVPQVYADWLKMKLFCWHKKMALIEVEDHASMKEHKQTKKTIKRSVPPEFRKWVKWYLYRHYGERRHHKDRKVVSGFQHEDMTKMKHNFFHASIPKGFRVWTKKFIVDWRLAKKLDNPEPSSSKKTADSSNSDTDTNTTDMSVPEAYKEWLEMFLLRWHTFRGYLERTAGQNLREGFGKFKDTVPWDYRGWVKQHMCANYNKNKQSKQEEKCSRRKQPNEDGDDVPTQRKYNKMLHAFQKMWVQQQQHTDEDSDIQVTMPSDSDEELLSNNGEAEDTTKLTKVRFAKSKDGKVKKIKMDDDYNSQTEIDYEDTQQTVAPKRKYPMNRLFRQWARQALTEWDGETFDSDSDQQEDSVLSEQEDSVLSEQEDADIPPNVYKWMSKMMKKQMKQQIKSAKREAKKASK